MRHIIATVGTFYIILGYNTAQIVESVEMPHEKQKHFVNFSAKTGTEILNGVEPNQDSAP